MGVTLPSTPPEDEPPMRRPRAPAQEPRQRAETPTLNDWPVPSGKAPESRKDSPPGGIRLEGPGGWRLSLPHAALLAILACFGGAGVAAKVASSGEGDRADMMAELRSIREELKGLRSDVREVRDEQAAGRRDDKKIVNFVQDSLTPLVASVRKLGVKLEYSGRDMASDVEFHPAPMAGSNAPPIQPKAVLPERPSL